MRSFFKRHVFRLALVVALAGVLSFNGCGLLDTMRGEGFRELDEDWSEGFRPPSKARRATGMTTKAREVERNLGIQ